MDELLILCKNNKDSVFTSVFVINCLQERVREEESFSRPPCRHLGGGGDPPLSAQYDFYEIC